MHRIAVVAMAVLFVAVAFPALAAEQAADVKALKEQVKSLQDANVVMKEDLAKTQLQMSEMDAKNRELTEAYNRQLAELAKGISELRQDLADERAAHEAALRQAQADNERLETEKKAAQAEAARQRSRAKNRQMWLYVLGGIGLIAAATR